MYTPPNKILEKLKILPSGPGVYLYSNSKKKIIYIGKAKNLKSRIKSYFLNIGKHQQFKTEILVQKIDNIEYILTDNEIEALLLESNLINKHKPKYNIDLKDDKSYPYIRITKELFPRVFITRTIIRDGSKYLGPYTQVKSIRSILKSLKKILKIRNCKLDITDDSIKSKKHKLCLDYHMKICNGVCKGFETANEYKQSVKNIESFVTGNDTELLKQLKDKMLEASENLEFELALKYRDQLRTLEDYRLKQKVQNAGITPKDYIAVSTEDNDSCCVVFKVRNGSLIARNHFFLTGAYNKSELEVLEEFIKLYYNTNFSSEDIDMNSNISQNLHVPDFFPDEIILESELEDKSAIADWLNTLSDRKGKSNVKQISLKVPVIGDKSKMIFLAKKNAEMLLNDKKLEKLKKDYTPRSLNSLKRDLNLPRLPRIIECFDISHFAGRETVASMVCFKNAKPFKSRYRRFKINTVEGIDDFASMREVVDRRYTRLKNDNEKDPKNNELPDLIMVDGGKGQLSSAVEILKRLELYDKIPVIGLAKRLEEVFKPNESEPEMIPRTSSALKLLQQLRDEAHRFAITYHRNLRGKVHVKSSLDNIEGLGPKKRELLIKTFGSLKKIKETNFDELIKVRGITDKIAKEIIRTITN